MIRAFQHIRKNLLSQRCKTLRYFAFVMGEFVTHVMDILIPLQANNQNKNQKKPGFGSL